MSGLDTNYKDKLDMNYNFNVQINRVFQSVGTPYFDDAVEMLSYTLPISAQLLLLGRRSEWNPIIQRFKYEYAGPIPLGTETEPLMDEINEWSGIEHPIPYITIKDEEAGTEETVIDWTSPHIISPRIVEEEVPDYRTYVKIILEEAENAGLSWNQDLTNAVRINTNPPLDKKPRPYLRGKIDEEKEQNTES